MGKFKLNLLRFNTYTHTKICVLNPCFDRIKKKCFTFNNTLKWKQVG